jgi:hypothetical protein
MGAHVYVQIFECNTNGGGVGVLPAIGGITPASTLATFAPYGIHYQQQFIGSGNQVFDFNPTADVVCIVPDTGATVNAQFRGNGGTQTINSPTYVTAPTFRP